MKFRFPWKSPDREAVAHPVRAECLVVEDQSDQRELMAHLLRLQGAVVTTAGNVAGALEVLNGPLRFQLAFVDLRLPGGSGVEIVRLIKERRPGTHPVLITGSPDLLMSALELGYVSVILKPYNVGIIRDVLRAHRLPYND